MLFLSWIFWSSGRRQHWPPKSIENLPTLADNSSSGPIDSRRKRASSVCQERQYPCNEIISLRYDHQLDTYPQGFIGSVINSKGSDRPSKEEKPLAFVYIPYFKGVADKFKRIGN
jgi:hypothetical protein